MLLTNRIILHRGQLGSLPQPLCGIEKARLSGRYQTNDERPAARRVSERGLSSSVHAPSLGFGRHEKRTVTRDIDNGMATFAQTSFNASIYSAGRPTYPGKLFKRILGYHKRSQGAAGFDLAVDLGCGTGTNPVIPDARALTHTYSTGQATRHLMPFRKVIAIDTSETMLSAARTLFSSPPWSTKVTFGQGSAEDLASVGIQDGTVDLLIAAQACHWFDWSKVWPETRRVLKKGGCAAYWVRQASSFLPSAPSRLLKPGLF